MTLLKAFSKDNIHVPMFRHSQQQLTKFAKRSFFNEMCSAAE